MILLAGSVVVSGAALGGPAGASPAAALQQQADGPSTQETSYLRVVHASADAPAVDVALDNETIVSGVELGEASDYLEIGAGDHRLTITAAESGDVVYDGNVSVEPRSVTTIAASGEVSENASQPFAPLFIRDDARQPAEGEAAVAVAHLSPDAPTVDVTVEGTGTVIAENVSYAGVSDYMTVPAGDYTLEIREATAENDGSVVTTVDVSLADGSAYTAYAVGYLNAENASDTENASGPGFQLSLAEDATTSVTLPSDADGNETEMPANETEMPANETEMPANETEMPANETETPMTTELPNETETEASANETESPA
ncbi:DUF4397 domain-containing protein [Halobaculum sp. WSA2]|uniref:DUF4397 domain-containing protein n=1 Tax=Halobaculum saliterrae TaxID=2073113 RepID=A0A6B0SUM0_9EURY|nr:DUF4397 domain-containing protein [Halobaculum saliterrae]MXR39892.1 DUF4397 domain-containing protein [Halobaculum saliterrae]